MKILNLYLITVFLLGNFANLTAAEEVCTKIKSTDLYLVSCRVDAPPPYYRCHYRIDNVLNIYEYDSDDLIDALRRCEITDRNRNIQDHLIGKRRPEAVFHYLLAQANTNAVEQDSCYEKKRARVAVLERGACLMDLLLLPSDSKRLKKLLPAT